jgi:hypothetical protein
MDRGNGAVEEWRIAMMLWAARLTNEQRLWINREAWKRVEERMKGALLMSDSAMVGTVRQVEWALIEERYRLNLLGTPVPELRTLNMGG